MSIELAIPSNHLILCCQLLLSSIFPSIGKELTFLMSQFFASGGQSIGASASALVLPRNIRVGFLKDWLVWSPYSPGDSKESSPTLQFKASVLRLSDFFMVQYSHPYMTTGKAIALIIWTFVGKVMFCFLMCCLVLSSSQVIYKRISIIPPFYLYLNIACESISFFPTKVSSRFLFLNHCFHWYYISIKEMISK